MKIFKIISSRKQVGIFSIVLLFLSGCSLDGSDQFVDKDLSLEESQISKTSGLLPANREFLDALKKLAENPPKIDDPEKMDPFARSNKKWVGMASGNGQNYDPFYKTNFGFKFSSKEDSEGNDVGWVKWSDADGNLLAAGEVDCLYVEGNKAWLRFLVYYGENGDFPWFIWIGFEDNGEGSKALPDRTTEIWAIPVLYGQFSTCESFAETNAFGRGFNAEWVKGNIQIQNK